MSAPKDHGKPWSPAEIAILKANRHRQNDEVERLLLAAGYERLRSSIGSKRRDMRMPPPDLRALKWKDVSYAGKAEPILEGYSAKLDAELVRQCREAGGFPVNHKRFGTYYPVRLEAAYPSLVA